MIRLLANPLYLVPDLGTFYRVPNIGTMSRTLHSKSYSNLIAWLKSGRQTAGLSMRDLSEKLGVSHSYIGKVEQNERRLDVLEYVEYCQALGLKPEEGIKIIRRARKR